MYVAVLVPVVLVKLGEALLVARVDAVNKPPAHQQFRPVLDEASLHLLCMLGHNKINVKNQRISRANRGGKGKQRHNVDSFGLSSWWKCTA